MPGIPNSIHNGKYSNLRVIESVNRDVDEWISCSYDSLWCVCLYLLGYFARRATFQLLPLFGSDYIDLNAYKR